MLISLMVTENEQEKVTETNPDEQEKVTETALVSVEEMAQVFIGGKQIALGMTEEELKAVWGKPDRMDETLYRLDRYIYLNQYEDYFFATMENGRIVEIFIPGTNFVYLGTEGKGTSADIKDLDYISAVEHSGIIKSDTVEARIPLNYEGEISGLLLQTADFSLNKNPMSVLHLSLQEDLEAELVDIIQVKRKAAGLELVTTDGKLTSVARAHSEDMVKNSYFDYNSPDGTTPFARIMKEGKSFLTASEVIAKQRGDVVNIYQEWIRTSAKIGGLTDGTMQEIGVGVAGKSKELYVTVDLCGQSTKKK